MRKFIYCILITMLGACAQQVAPTGGPKDETPPKVLKCIPDSFTTHFPTKIGNHILIRFDEFIQVKDAQQIIISPPIQGKATEYLVKGKVLDIKLNDSLQSDKTYTINFANAITDNHEYKPLENYSYVFSTGNSIDSSSISGMIKNAFTLKPEKDIYVGLYKAASTQDTMLLKEPLYFTKTRENGSFKINYLPNGKFFVLAFKKEGGGLRYQKTNETAYLPFPIELNNQEVAVSNLYLFKPYQYKKNKLLDAKFSAQGLMKLAVYRSENLKIKSKVGDSIIWKKNRTELGTDSIDVFIQSKDKDSIEFEIICSDTSYFIKKYRSNKLKFNEFKISSTISKLKPKSKISIQTNNPIYKLNNDKIKFYIDTNLIKNNIFKIDSGLFSISNSQNTKEDETYKIVLGDSAITDMYGQYNKKQELRLEVRDQKESGNLILHVDHYKRAYPSIVQLVDEEDHIKETAVLHADTTYSFSYLEPGTYRIKVLFDSNRNGVWDRGELDKAILPEQVYYYPEKIGVRAYWDIEQTMDLSLAGE